MSSGKDSADEGFAEVPTVENIRLMIRQQFKHSNGNHWERLQEKVAARRASERANAPTIKVPEEEDQMSRPMTTSRASSRSASRDASPSPDVLGLKSKTLPVMGPGSALSVGGSREASRSTTPVNDQDMTDAPKKSYTFTSTNVHSTILNRRLSMAENVKKNYGKYIRDQDLENNQETKEDRTAKSGRPRGEGVSLPSTNRTKANVSIPIRDISLTPLFKENSSLEISLPQMERTRSVPDSVHILIPDSPKRPRSTELQYQGSKTEKKLLPKSAERSRQAKGKQITKEELKSLMENETSTIRFIARKVKSGMENTELERLEFSRRVEQARKDVKWFYSEEGIERRKRAMQMFSSDMDKIMRQLHEINMRLDERLRCLDGLETLPPGKARKPQRGY